MLIAQPPDGLMNARQIAVALGVTERTVRRWISGGRLSGERIGRSYAIRLSEAQRVRDAATGVVAINRVEQLAELRGRYDELTKRLEDIESRLADERRRNGFLEALLLKQARAA